METPINLMKMGINLSTNEFDYPLYVLMDGMNISNAKQFCSAYMNFYFNQICHLDLFLLMQNYGNTPFGINAEAKRSLGGQSIIKRTPLNFRF